MTQSGLVLLSAQADLMKVENGDAKPSNAFLRYWTFSGGISPVASAVSGRCSTEGSGKERNCMAGDRSGCIFTSLSMFVGVEI
ncbi:hypothetical protein FCM35_KLT05540 [Carex littledalei]|uniref:Uncharacterized protein n=1 Tax=Carex littledalei TaxID=544730 RepID=A0A833VPD3_9POAL|nr:hypothetical protein FCM35_KLT05540 [Carex littledalei]